MERLTTPADSLTEIQRRSGVTVHVVYREASHSSTRRIPYAERYRQFTGLLETPEEHLQRAVEDEDERRARTER